MMTRPLRIAAVAALTLIPAMAGAQDAPRLVTILTASEPQTQLMAMVLTANAVQQGAEARILLCGPGGDIALKDAPEGATAGQPPSGATPQGVLMQMINESGVTAQVCATYLPVRGETADVLMPGITSAKPDAIAAELITAGTTVLTF